MATKTLHYFVVIIYYIQHLKVTVMDHIQKVIKLMKLLKHLNAQSKRLNLNEQHVIINTDTVVEIGIIRKHVLIDISNEVCLEHYLVERIQAESHDIIYGEYSIDELLFE